MKNVIIEAKEGLNWRHFVHSLLKLFFKVMSRRWCLGCCVFNGRKVKQNLCTSHKINFQCDDKDTCQQLATAYLFLLVLSSFQILNDSYGKYSDHT